MQAWLATRRYGRESRFTVYLATEANRIHAPGVVPAPTAPIGRTTSTSTRVA
jgi:hypothetical protein